ncbi:MAG: methyltransferase domain-containing protein [Gammaproteobacteria bacterium]|nr:methyltransferase domain-containing protein [Gammaproteobacteria bacterium]
MDKPKGPSAFVNEAYRAEDEAGLVAFYGKWAEDYDNQMSRLGYVSPEIIARLLTEYCTERQADIFDIGCGTGLTGVYLAERGYRRLDGIDLSAHMVRVAGQRGIYRELLVGDVNQPLDRPSASYDAVISSGTFTHGHVGPQPLAEIVRILRPGGVLACTVHKDLWYASGFDTTFASLLEAGHIECLRREFDVYFTGGEPEGWFCVYRRR